MGDFFLVKLTDWNDSGNYKVFEGPDNTAALAFYNQNKQAYPQAAYFDVSINQPNTIVQDNMNP